MSTKSVDATARAGRSRLPWLQNILLDWDKTQLLVSFIVLGLIALSPLFISSPYYLGIVVLTTLYMFTGISWNIVAGFAGRLLIAHIIFLAVGAYTTIVLYNTFGVSPWIGIPLSGLTAAFLGLIVAFITLRYGLKMDYFALFTIATMVAMKALFLKWDFVGGAVGMGLSLSDPGWQKMIFANKQPYLYIALVLAVVGVIIQYAIYRSKMGKYFMAIREDEAAAAALGVNTSLYSTLALLIGSAMAGIGGGFYVMYVTFVEPPQVFDLGLNVEIIMAAPIIGGLGSLAGPVLGSLLNKPLVEFIRGFLSGGRSGTTLIVYGAFLILAILFMPRGVTGLLHTLYLKLRRRLAPVQTEEA
ncbi:branched-chain amino acid ABC transporter permease [Promineifilum sp.]|uniref:branched-chain amino acid ABC transporter permease n=1 Tax=Promineifilum sp. TaxID=2664178 RepID=UPI0035AFBB03